MFSRYQNHEFFSLTHIPRYFNGISHNSAGWFLAVSENSRNFAPDSGKKKEKGTGRRWRKRRAQRRRWRKRKRKRAYSCLKKQPYTLYRELSLKRNYRLSGQCNAPTITAQSWSGYAMSEHAHPNSYRAIQTCQSEPLNGRACQYMDKHHNRRYEPDARFH